MCLGQIRHKKLRLTSLIDGFWSVCALRVKASQKVETSQGRCRFLECLCVAGLMRQEMQDA